MSTNGVTYNQTIFSIRGLLEEGSSISDRMQLVVYLLKIKQSNRFNSLLNQEKDFRYISLNFGEPFLTAELAVTLPDTTDNLVSWKVKALISSILILK
ncbi:hypothetical protein, partial [Pseudomonas gingeri]|uniref:hypothetical protein n=1 Tax=Pseudomonas gingeri TaxID=117681 RepID=UPI001C4363F9